MKKKIFYLLILVASIPSCTKQDDNVVSVADQTFIKVSYQENQADIQMSQIVRTRGINTRLKTFAQQLIQRSSLTTDEILNLAKERNIVVPVELSSSSVLDVKNLIQMPSEDFDQSYLEKIIESRNRTINFYEQQINKSKDNALREWASQKLSGFYKDLNNAQTLHTEVKK